MEITRKNWQTYIDNLAKADDKAAALVMQYLETHEIASEKGFQEFANFFYNVVTRYSEGASEMAAQAYEIIAEAQGAFVPAAMPAVTPSYGDVMKAIQGTMLSSDQPKALGQAAGRLVRRTGVDTTINNALRDGAEWAWVPSGDTCAFCMMLASNGWQRASKKAIKNGHAKHIHANCDCTYAIRFDGKSTVEGYDPDYYKAIHDNAEGDKWQDKLNSMRRDKYAQNKDKINAQKRSAYRRRKDIAIGGTPIDSNKPGGYNTPPGDEELRRRYERDVKQGWISALCGFDNYKKLYWEIDGLTNGLETKAGTVIQRQSEHFLARVIGTSLDPARVKDGVYYIAGINPQGFKSNARSGVSVDAIVEALKNGRVYPASTKNGVVSQKYKGGGCIVTVNPNTGVLIQCNPTRR